MRRRARRRPDRARPRESEVGLDAAKRPAIYREAFTNRHGAVDLRTGDLVFAGGYGSILSVPGCELGKHRHTIPRLMGLGVDARFRGQKQWAISGGRRHLDAAVHAFERSRLRENLPRFRV